MKNIFMDVFLSALAQKAEITSNRGQNTVSNKFAWIFICRRTHSFADGRPQCEIEVPLTRSGDAAKRQETYLFALSERGSVICENAVTARARAAWGSSAQPRTRELPICGFAFAPGGAEMAILHHLLHLRGIWHI